MKSAPLKALSIKPLMTCNWEAARALADASLGEGYFGGNATDTAKTLWLGAFEGDKLVGMARALLAGGRDLELGADWQRRIFCSPHQEVGVLKTLVVAPAFRGRGLGGRLTEARLNWLRARVTQVVTLSWDGAGAGAVALLRRQGFQELGRLPAPFARETLRHGIHCPLCGAPPCRCAGILFHKTLREGT